jgi:hypothetical protein
LGAGKAGRELDGSRMDLTYRLKKPGASLVNEGRTYEHQE